jgi:hypothetical protein
MFRKAIILLSLLLLVAGSLLAESATDPALRPYTTPAGLQDLIETEEVPYLLVDVRTPAEYAPGQDRLVDFGGVVRWRGELER